MSTITAIDEARQQYHKGNHEAAERMCRDIVAAAPENHGAHHILGLIAFKNGDANSAIASLQEAITLDETNPLYHNHLGATYGALKQFDQARQSLETAISLDADLAEAQFNLGNVLRALKQNDAAAEAFSRAVEIDEKYHEAHFNLGNLRLEQGQLVDAIGHLERAVEAKPDYGKAHRKLIRPLQDYAEQLVHIGDPSAGARTYGRLGVALQAIGKNEDAIKVYRHALQLDDQQAEIHVNLGVAQKCHGELEESIASFHRAIELLPDCLSATSNMGRSLSALGEHEQGQACYQRSLELDGDHVSTHFARACSWLQTGDFRRGWPEYEWRWQHAGYSPDYPLPQWKGEDLNGTTLLVRTEQGLGDNIQFIRYAKLLQQRGARVVVECHGPLLRLFEECTAVDAVIARNEEAPNCDLYVNLLSVPGILQTSIDAVPAEVPYIEPDATLIHSWQERLKQVDKFKIGVAWRAKPTEDGKLDVTRYRSFPLAAMAPLAALPHVQLVNLQQRDGLEQIASLPEGFNLLELGPEVDGDSGAFMDTAAILKSLDLVICCDSAVGHLAGAVGAPTWLVLPFWPDWRWTFGRDDNAWYPGHQLFRQPKPGDWDGVFANMATKLSQHTKSS